MVVNKESKCIKKLFYNVIVNQMSIKSPLGVAISSDLLVQRSDGKWILNHPFAQNGGSMFAAIASWCGHCKRLKANVNEAFKIKPFSFFYLDCSDDNSVVKQKLGKMKINGFPTIFYVDINGILIPYDGDRSPQTLAKVFR
jgi:thiol-disulfide isomerase/thioredoxin